MDHLECALLVGQEADLEEALVEVLRPEVPFQASKEALEVDMSLVKMEVDL